MPLRIALVATRRRAVVGVQTGLLETRATGDHRKNGQRRRQGRAKRGNDGFQVSTRARRRNFGAFFGKSGGRRRCRPRGRGARGGRAHKLTRAEGRRRGDVGRRRAPVTHLPAAPRRASIMSHTRRHRRDAPDGATRVDQFPRLAAARRSDDASAGPGDLRLLLRAAAHDQERHRQVGSAGPRPVARPLLLEACFS